MTEKEAYERMYDDFASGYRACCRVSREVSLVLEDIKDLQEKKKILSAAKSGWVERMKMLDQKLAEQGEP